MNECEKKINEYERERHMPSRESKSKGESQVHMLLRVSGDIQNGKYYVDL